MNARLLAALRRFWPVPAGLALIVVLTWGTVYVTGTDHACGMCHSEYVSTWHYSGHSKTGCPACHEGHRPWYRLPETLIPRAGMVEQRLAGKIFGPKPTDETTITHAEMRVDQERCLSCHTWSRKASTHNDTVIDHAEHAKRNQGCLTCHEDLAHPDEAASSTCSRLMARCFTCHGRTESAKAPGECNVCHPKNFKLVPATHDSTWEDDHPRSIQDGKKPCTMCHDSGFCRSCHGVEMPHPKNWVKSKTGHSATDERDWSVCEKCHHKGPNGCKSCHHERYTQKTRRWIEQHPEVVDKQGSATCFDCHRPTVCAECHVKRQVADSGMTRTANR